jgi:general secretion pathway protein B
MSYILDALRKAERERNLGQPPSMQAVTQPSALPRPGRRPLWPILLALAALLLVATLAAVAWKYHRAANVPAAAEALPSQPAPAPAGAPALPGAVSSFDDLAPPEPALPPVEEELPEETPAAAPPAVAQHEEAGTPVTPAEPEPAEEPEAAEEPILPLVRDMPPGWRASFPQLTVEVHVYDDSPAKRWVMIGSRRYREGETLAQGPRLAEITPDGIVFEHQGQRALLPIAR